MATNFAAVATSIRTEFNAQWPSLAPTYPSFMQNDVPTKKDAAARYVTVQIMPADSRQIALPAMGRDWGLVSVQIFVPLSEGDGELREVCDVVRNLFMRRTIDNVRFQMPRIAFMGPVGSKYQATVNAPFWADFSAN
jgi:hypothetical protein